MRERINPIIYLLGSVLLAACFIAGFLLLVPKPVVPPSDTSELDAAKAQIAELRRQIKVLTADVRIVPLSSRFSPSASHCYKNDTVRAMNDGIEPRNSNDHTIPRFTWWDQMGTQWVQYDFDTTHRVSSVAVYWFEDGEGCSVPVSWTILYLENGEFRPVETTATPGVMKDAWNTVDFKPVETHCLRLEARLQDGCSGGIMEWKVFGTD